MAKLGPDVITEEINIDDDDPATDTDSAVETCVSVQCQKQIKGGIPLLWPVVTSATTGLRSLTAQQTLRGSFENAWGWGDVSVGQSTC